MWRLLCRQAGGCMREQQRCTARLHGATHVPHLTSLKPHIMKMLLQEMMQMKEVTAIKPQSEAL